MALSTSDFKTGLTIEYEGNVYQIVDFQHVKPGKGGAFVRSHIRNLKTGNTVEKTWRAGDKMDQAIVERRSVEYLYRDGEDLVFMDMSDFENLTLPAKQAGAAVNFLKDNTTVQLVQWKEQLLNIELPTTMEFLITQADPGERGNTAQGGSKSATLETGAVVSVPMFVNEGETIRVRLSQDTQTGQYTGQYSERVK